MELREGNLFLLNVWILFAPNLLVIVKENGGKIAFVMPNLFLITF